MPLRPGPLLRRPNDCGPSTTTGRSRGSRSRRLTPIDPCWRTHSLPTVRSIRRGPETPAGVRSVATPATTSTSLMRLRWKGGRPSRLATSTASFGSCSITSQASATSVGSRSLSMRPSIPTPGRSTPQTNFATPAPTGTTTTAPLSTNSPDEGLHSSMAAGSSPARC